MITYLKHMGKYTHNQLKSKSFEEIQKLYKKEEQWINDFVPMSDDNGKKDDSSSKQAESSMKRPRAEHDEERDDIAIDVESLATKYPIVDWKTHILTENMMYYQIIRADRSSKNYKIFIEMLDDFDRQDVMDLHRLVKERLYLTRRSLEVLRKFYWMILGGRFNKLSHVSSLLLSKPGEY
ncbi:hypothetical protein Tco_1101734 [Tanacetum coccineum]